MLKKDLLRDSRHPWGLIVLMIVPVLTALIIALVFSPQGDIQKNITVHVAILDRDDDFIAGLIRSLSGQGNASENLQVHLVESEEAGLKLVERRKVSAFVVLPKNLTLDLLDGTTTAITLYKNPAESVLPQIVEEALQILSIGMSQALDLLRPEMQAIRGLLDRDQMPSALEVATIASSSVTRLKSVESYLFPPLIQFETVKASEYVARRNQDPNEIKDPNQ